MPYFTAVMSRKDGAWIARDVDLDEFESLDDLAASLRGSTGDEETVLAFVEREDAWWAAVRLEADDDPRVFVSDVSGAATSTYADLLQVPDDDAPSDPPSYGGDLDVLADLGTSPAALQEMCEDEVLPMDALAAVAEAAGFAQELDSLR